MDIRKIDCMHFLLSVCRTRTIAVNNLAISLLWLSALFLLFTLALYATNVHREGHDFPSYGLKYDAKEDKFSDDATISLSEMFNESHVEQYSKRNQHMYKKKDHVLVVVDSFFTRTQLIIALESNHFQYTVENATDFSAVLTFSVEFIYSVVIFERLESYLALDSSNRKVLDDYCKDNHVGIFTVSRPMKYLNYAQVRGFPLYIHSGVRISDLVINPHLDILNLTKAGSVIHNPSGTGWTLFFSIHSTYTPITFANISPKEVELPFQGGNHSYVTAILDKGEYDGIRRVIFGYDFNFWLFELLFIDALRYLSGGRLQVALDRHLQVDIDDMLQSGTGSRVTPGDVKALLATQTRIQEHIPGFRFHLGYCGHNFMQGSDLENQADIMLIENAHSFHWFDHTWGHVAPHKLNYSDLHDQMNRNKQFAEEHNIPVNTSYAVAPWHSGVYPVHEELYACWKRVWGVRVTSTEEYPRLMPPWERKGFIHIGVKVLPRQTCGLYTKNKYWSEYPGGPDKLKADIYGGHLFFTFIYTPVMVFMTHQQNYMGDRLALFTFEEILSFLREWTNLRIISEPPSQLAEKYFNLYPEQREPVWTHPCKDKRHKDIWSPEKSCKRFPEFIIIGPERTGTTALYTFLKMHRKLIANKRGRTASGDVRFFDSDNYLEGLDWYMNHFPKESTVNVTKPIYFEKSATYFASEQAAIRIKALSPDVKLIAVLTDPALRAYSCFQHLRARNNRVASENTFNDVITASSHASSDVIALKEKCMFSSIYAKHLETWLDHFSPKQILILDGGQLKEDPVAALKEVQKFLKLRNQVDYSKLLEFNKAKGFFCPIINATHVKCLDETQGHMYPEMDRLSAAYLRLFFRKENRALHTLLKDAQLTIPKWLEDVVSKNDGN